MGDCYLIAAYSALAEWQDRVKRVFVTKDYNKEGIIVVKGQVLGIEKNIVVDDYLPFKKNTTNLMFNYISPQNSLWVSFLEKVWAKVNGFYE